MSFEITITEKRTVVKKNKREWAILGTVETVRDDSIYDRDKSKGPTRIEDVHGWTPEVEQEVEDKQEIYKQTVGTINLAQVIKAINQLP